MVYECQVNTDQLGDRQLDLLDEIECEEDDLHGVLVDMALRLDDVVDDLRHVVVGRVAPHMGADMAALHVGVDMVALQVWAEMVVPHVGVGMAAPRVVVGMVVPHAGVGDDDVQQSLVLNEEDGVVDVLEENLHHGGRMDRGTHRVSHHEEEVD